MKTMFFKSDSIKENRLMFLSMNNRPVEARTEAPKPEEKSPVINDEAHQVLDRTARYREELSKRLDRMDKNSPKYKLFEKTYNDLTDSQEKLEKSISENDPKKDEIVNNTFNKIHEILKNPHLSIVRSLMIQKQLKEVKKAFTEEIGHIKADSVIPLVSMMSRRKNGASVEDGRTYEVPGILIRREGDNIKLVINDKLYEFSTRVINGKWKFFDKKGSPLKDISAIPVRTGAESLLGGLDEEDYKQKIVQKSTEVLRGPALKKREKIVEKPVEEPKEEKPEEEAIKPRDLKAEKEQERIVGNNNAMDQFKSEWGNIDDFISSMKKTDWSLEQTLAVYGFKPPYNSGIIDDGNHNRYKFILEDNKDGGTLKIEKQRLSDGNTIVGLKYIALEKTGNNPVNVYSEPKTITVEEKVKEENASGKEPKNVREWREAALKSANDLLEKVKSNDAMKQFANDLIKADGIKMDGRTIEDKAEKYKNYMDIAVRFRNKITYAMESLKNPGDPLKTLEDNVNNALAILPKNSQNIYLAKFKKNTEENIMLARKKAPAEEPNKQV